MKRAVVIGLLSLACAAHGVAQWAQCPGQAAGVNTCTDSNVGIGTGTTAPAQKLVVFGNTRVASGDLYLDNDRSIRAGGGDQSLVYRASAGGIYYGSGDPADFIVFNAGGTEKLRITTAGNLGIGHSPANGKLDLKGALWIENASTDHAIRIAPGTTGGTHLIDANYAASGGLLPLRISANTPTSPYQLYLDTSGNVGIGGPPSDKLHVLGRVRVDGGPGASKSALMTFIGTDATSVFRTWYAGVNAFSADGSFEIKNTVGGGMTIDSLGNVGIGVTVPGARLDVNGTIFAAGDINSAGRINAKFQDVAEWVPAATDLTAGTVVVLDEDHNNTVRESSSAYDDHVAGVVSARPGVVLGESGSGKALIATTGRVRVKADATESPIKIGDLLVTSSRMGMAMKSIPIELGGRRMHAPGTILGKALEPLPSGDGEILVLLTLQ
ncbi:MAG TPA: hypothetical protein VLV78_21100 [Thermoanaerobaculia bacterium]|nr:hypothetical protein [Thermoanaerobaculia bacterium]